MKLIAIIQTHKSNNNTNDEIYYIIDYDHDDKDTDYLLSW